MHYDFIEIGTSNFDSLIEKSSDTTNGLSIEPLKHLLDQLPNKLNITKINLAISNQHGSIDIYHVPQATINKYELPWWFIGSNSVGHPHAFVVKAIEERNLPVSSIVQKDTVTTKRLSTIIDEYNVKSFRILKIDTEGHDAVILEDYLKDCELNNYPKPTIIQFEHNGLYPEEDYIKVKDIATKLGYKINEYVADTIMYRE